MHDSLAISFGGLLLLAFIGFLLLAGVGLLIYSIVSKRYWLTAILLILPLGLIAFSTLAFIRMNSARTEAFSNSPLLEQQIDHPIRQGGFNEVNSADSQHTAVAQGDSRALGPAEATEGDSVDFQRTDQATYKYSASKPLTADVYPSIAMCARPLAFQLANDIRESNQFPTNTKFAIEFTKALQFSDAYPWQPTDSFNADFQKELIGQFPGSSVVTTTETDLVATSKNFKKLDIRFYCTDSKSEQTSGLIQTHWSIGNKPSSITSTNYVDKRWVTNPAEYLLGNTHRRLVIGTTQRLARSPEEAGVLAILNADNQQARKFGYGYTPARDQIVDRFTQKLTMPYGELWQEAVLVAFNPNDSNDETIMVNRPKHPASRLRQSRRGLVQDQGLTHPAISPNVTYTRTSPGIMLLFLTVGMLGIAWVSNLMTQGYYRTNINHTLVTAVLVIFGLVVLGLLMA